MTSDGSSREVHTRTPFNSPLIESGFYNPTGVDRILALKDNPDKIVRVRGRSQGDEKVQSFLVRHKHVLDTLKNDYGFDIPNVDIIIGPGETDDSRTREYIVTDRIHGQTLDDKKFTPSELPTAREKIDKLYSSMVQYYWDISKNGGDYNNDLPGTMQFVWGRKKGDTEDKIYLVDVGLEISHHNLDSESNNRLLRHVYVPDSFRRFIYMDLAELEEIHKFRLDGARQKLGQFMDDLLARGPLEKEDIAAATELRQRLEDDK